MFNFNIGTTISQYVQRLMAILTTWVTNLFAKPQPVSATPVRPKLRKSAPPPARPMLFLPLLEQKEVLQPAAAGPAINPLYLPVLVKREPVKPVGRSNQKLSKLAKLIGG